MEEKEEDKGFVVRDRRKLSPEDADRAENDPTPVEDAAGKEHETKKRFEEAGRNEARSGAQLPEVSFSTFIFSLSSSALVHLGEIPEPDTRHTRTDLPMAKQIIDTLGMLEEKSRGNRDPNEDQLLKTVLYDLRLRYIQKCG